VTRPISEQVGNELLIELSALPGATRLRPGPLTEADVGRLIERTGLQDADERFVSVCAHLATVTRSRNPSSAR